MGALLPRKNGIFHLKWRVLVHSERYFCPCRRHKNVEFPPEVGDLVDVEDVLLRSNEFSVKFMGLVSLLLHCNSSNLVFEILKHDKTWGTICISVPFTLSSGGSSPVRP